MRTFRTRACVLLACLLLAAVAAGATTSAPDSGYAPDVVLVAFHDQAPAAARFAVLARYGLENDPRVRSPYFARLRIGARARGLGASVASTAAALSRDPAVRCVEPDYRARIEVRPRPFPDDPFFNQQWNLQNLGQTRTDMLTGTPDADVDGIQAWNSTTGSSSVIVAVVDTGVDYLHEDLADNILRDVDGIVGHDFFSDDADPADTHGHGTVMASIIGARGNNRKGIAGLNWTAKLMPIRFLGNPNGSGDTSLGILAIDFARVHGAHVINNSWGTTVFSQLLLEALQRARDAGILCACSAGNENVDNDVTPHFPSGFNTQSANVLSVGASTDDDDRAGVSNFGATSVDLFAPGEAILGAAIDPANLGNHAIYGRVTGTSASAAHVSGAAALVLAANPGITLANLRSRLVDTTDPGVGLGGLAQHGRLNVANALFAAGQPGGAIKVKPVRLNYGKVTINTAGKTKGFTISNTSSQFELVVTIPNPSAPYSVVGGGRTVAILEKGSLEVDVLFAPTAKGKFTQNLSLDTNDPDTDPFVVKLDGTGK